MKPNGSQEEERSKQSLRKAIELNNQRNFKEAIDCCDEALKMNPMNDAIWDEKAYALWGLGRIEEALDCCNSALRVNSNFIRVWHTRGYILAEMGRHKDAVESLQKYIELETRPENAEVVRKAREEFEWS